MTPHRLTCALSLLAVLTGCANYSGITPQAQPRQDIPYQLEQPSASANPSESWWKSFDDAQLNQLIEQALTQAPSLQLAQARLRRAQSGVEFADSARYPQAQAELDTMRQRFSSNSLYPPPFGGSTLESGTAQLSASWELDFFGKNRAALDAALGNARATQADTAAARLLLETAVANTYFRWQALVAQRQLAERQVVLHQAMLTLVRQRVRAGLEPQQSKDQAEGTTAESRQQLERLLEQEAFALHALTAVIGSTQAPQLTPRPLPAATALAAPSELPLNLLGRRPDVQAARWRVEAATGNVAQAKALFYPNVNLTAFAGYSSIGLGQLTEAGSRQWGVGPAVSLPLFEGGRLKANLRGATAELDMAVESYNAAVTEALRDTSDQLSTLQSLSRQQTQQATALEAAHHVHAQALQRQKAGLSSPLASLQTEAAMLEQERQSLELQAHRLGTQTALVRALGGAYTVPAHP